MKPGPLLLALLTAASAAAQTPRNIILFIGDGMGPAHVTAAKFARGEKFQMGRFPVVGMVTTQAANVTVTDSAAAATAYATGTKTNYEWVSVDPSGQRLRTVLEMAERAGRATGLVTTAEFWDATPAAFAAHVKHRNQTLEITRQMLRSGVDLIVGGVKSIFGRDGIPSLEALADEAGFALVRTLADLESARGPNVLAVFPAQVRHGDFPEARLPDLARLAIDRLARDPDGFFLLVEHEGIDTSSHKNNTDDVRAGLISFDQAVGVGLEFAAGRRDTLVVVTGDHETGGLRIYETKSGRPRLEWSTPEHTASVVPIFAIGPGSSSFGGFMDNTDVGKRLISFMPP